MAYAQSDPETIFKYFWIFEKEVMSQDWPLTKVEALDGYFLLAYFRKVEYSADTQL